MASGVAIQVANLHDGLRALVTLNGTVVGTLHFWASRTPDVAQATQVPYVVVGSQYYVTLDHPSLWYLWAKDDNGYTASPAAVWIGISDHREANEIGERVRDILRDNRLGLEAALRQWYASATLKQVEYGFPGEILEFPSIVVLNPRYREPYRFFPYGRESTFTFTLAFMLAHADEQSQLAAAVEFARAGMLILNQPAYETLILPSGLEVNFCQAEEGECTEIDLGEMGFYSAGTLLWSGNALRQDTG